MKRVISSPILVILLALTGVNAQNNGARTNDGKRKGAVQPAVYTDVAQQGKVRFLVIGDTGTGTKVNRNSRR